MADTTYVNLTHTAAQVDNNIDDSSAHMANTNIHTSAAEKEATATEINKRMTLYLGTYMELMLDPDDQSATVQKYWLKAYKTPGVYIISSGISIGANTGDFPDNWVGGACKMVVSYTTTATGNRVEQILFPAANTNSLAIPIIWRRYMTGDGVFGGWITFQSPFDRAMVISNNVDSTHFDIKALPVGKWFRISNLAQASTGTLPSDFSGSIVCNVENTFVSSGTMLKRIVLYSMSDASLGSFWVAQQYAETVNQVTTIKWSSWYKFTGTAVV